MSNIDFSFEKIHSWQIHRVAAISLVTLTSGFAYNVVSNYIFAVWLEEANVLDNCPTVYHSLFERLQVAVSRWRRGTRVCISFSRFTWMGLFPLASSRVIPHKGKWSVYPRDDVKEDNPASRSSGTPVPHPNFLLFILSRPSPLREVPRLRNVAWYYNYCKDDNGTLSVLISCLSWTYYGNAIRKIFLSWSDYSATRSSSFLL